MSTIYNQIQPITRLLLAQLSSLPAVTIDTSSEVTQFVQQLLSNSNFFGATLQSESTSPVVILNVSAYQTIQMALNCLPGMVDLININKCIAAAGGKQLFRCVLWTGAGTLLTIFGVYKTAMARAQKQTAVQNTSEDHGYRFKAIALVGISAIAYSMYKTYEITSGLLAIA